MLGNGPVGVQNKNIDSFRLELEIPYSTEIVEDFSTYLLLYLLVEMNWLCVYYDKNCEQSKFLKKWLELGNTRVTSVADVNNGREERFRLLFCFSM